MPLTALNQKKVAFTEFNREKIETLTPSKWENVNSIGPKKTASMALNRKKNAAITAFKGKKSRVNDVEPKKSGVNGNQRAK